LNNGWLRNHKTGKNETSNLFAIVDLDLKDADELIPQIRLAGPPQALS
jgi:hypothetical protein